MSIRVISAILDADTGSPGTKLVLMILADFAREDGGSIYPSMETVAQRACMNECTVRRNIKKLIDAGWIIKEGKGFGKTNRYRIPNPGVLPTLAKIPPPNPGVLHVTPGVLHDNPLYPLKERKEFLQEEEEEVVFPWDLSPTGWVPNSVVKDVADLENPEAKS